jgi:hypothetical protein
MRQPTVHNRTVLAVQDLLIGLPHHDRLQTIAAVRQMIEAEAAHAVHELRDSGATWDAIGQALGTSRQGAWDRYTRASDGTSDS